MNLCPSHNLLYTKDGEAAHGDVFINISQGYAGNLAGVRYTINLIFYTFVLIFYNVALFLYHCSIYHYSFFNIVVHF